MIAHSFVDASFAAYRERRDEASLRALMDEHIAAVRSVVRRVLSRRDLAEDAVQETFVQLSRKHETVRGPLAPWLRRVAMNAALNLLRVESAQQRNGRVYEENRVAFGQQEELDPEVRSVISLCISRLPEQHRSVIARGFFLGMSQADIAVEDGITQVAVHKRMRAALSALRWEILKSGLGGCLGSLGQRDTGHAHHSVASPDSISLTVVALFHLIQWAAAAGVHAGVTAAAWTEVKAGRLPGRGSDAG